jgi:hypothetical protein
LGIAVAVFVAQAARGHAFAVDAAGISVLVRASVAARAAIVDIVHEVDFTTRVGVLVAVTEAVVARDRAARAGARGDAVVRVALLAASQTVLDGAEARLA